MTRLLVGGENERQGKRRDFASDTMKFVRLVVPSGGGYGDPKQRDHAMIEEDLREGYVSAEAARREYSYPGV